MIGVFANRTYRHLFAAQALSLVGTGLTTVALALLAYDIAEPNAGAVLLTALALKMVGVVALDLSARRYVGAIWELQRHLRRRAGSDDLHHGRNPSPVRLTTILSASAAVGLSGLFHIVLPQERVDAGEQVVVFRSATARSPSSRRPPTEQRTRAPDRILRLCRGS
jgi:hypothetical protein